MTDIPGAALGELIRRERKRRGDSKQDAADRFGISESTLFRWESGEDRPEDDTFAAIARYLGLTAEEVYVMAHSSDAPPDSMRAMRLEIAALWRTVDAQRDALVALRAEVGRHLVGASTAERTARGKRAATSESSTKAAAKGTKQKNATTKAAASPGTRKRTP